LVGDWEIDKITRPVNLIMNSDIEALKNAESTRKYSDINFSRPRRHL